MNITTEQAARSHETKSDLILGVSVALMVLGSVLVGLRLWCRSLIRSIGWDDLAAVLALAFFIACGTSIAAMTRYGLGRHSWTLSPDQLILYGRCFWLSVLFYMITMYLCKMTFLLQYLRIMDVSRMRWVYIGSMVFVSLWSLGQIVGIVLLCVPLQALWDPRVKGTCFKHETVMWYVNGILHIIIDFAIIIMPLPIVWRLKLPLSQKFLLSGIFGLGFFTIAISIFRLQWLTPAKDVTWWNVTAASWSLAELVSGIACSCLPTYKPLLNKVKSWIPPVEKGDGHGTDDSDKTLTMILDDAPHGSRPQVPNSMHVYRKETSIMAAKDGHFVEAVEEVEKQS